MSPVPVSRTTTRFRPDPSRTILKAFIPESDASAEGSSRLDRILDRSLACSEEDVVRAIRVTEARFGRRHRDLLSTFEAHFALVAGRLENPDALSKERRLLIGACLTSEYAVESAALTNPSIVPAPDQDALPPGAVRFVLSLRSIGEGHVSSIQFRSGVVDPVGGVEMEPPSRHVTTGTRRAPLYEKRLFASKLSELHSFDEIAAAVLDTLSARFTFAELEASIHLVDREHDWEANVTRSTRPLHWLASSNYETSFPADSALSERVLFPAGPTESNGMEDARFVRFTRDDGSITYFATYTAFDGHEILPQLIETENFSRFRIATLNGHAAKNKGIALFPRKIDGQYVALGRVDNENNFIMRASDVRFWHEHALLQRPSRPWELTHVGNCGSPIETEAGWLVLTHGVGPLRQYSLGAILLARDEPERVIGRLMDPLMEPIEDERDGYVPNVVYSCGSMVSGDVLVLPYGFSDVGARIATVRMEDLLSELTSHEARG